MSFPCSSVFLNKFQLSTISWFRFSKLAWSTNKYESICLILGKFIVHLRGTRPQHDAKNILVKRGAQRLPQNLAVQSACDKSLTVCFGAADGWEPPPPRPLERSQSASRPLDSCKSRSAPCSRSLHVPLRPLFLFIIKRRMRRADLHWTCLGFWLLAVVLQLFSVRTRLTSPHSLGFTCSLFYRHQSAQEERREWGRGVPLHLQASLWGGHPKQQVGEI